MRRRRRTISHPTDPETGIGQHTASCGLRGCLVNTPILGLARSLPNDGVTLHRHWGERLSPTMIRSTMHLSHSGALPKDPPRATMPMVVVGSWRNHPLTIHLYPDVRPSRNAFVVYRINMGTRSTGHVYRTCDFLFSAIAIAVLRRSCLSRSVCITTLHVALCFLTPVSCLGSFPVSWDLF